MLSSNLNLECDFEYVKCNITKVLLQYYKHCNNTLCRSIQYSLINDGKKYRPFLLWASGKAFNVEEKLLFKIGGILEILHTYSLIHDDLPSMDNECSRHGKPSLHKEYSESIAILTGDAILTDAFAFLSDKNNLQNSEVAVEVIYNISTYLGSKGMVLGQAMEMLISNEKRLTLKEIQQIHYLKTAKFMEVSVLLGGILAKTDSSIKNKLILYGKNIGLVFQMQDDIEDFATDSDMINICNFIPISKIKKDINYLIDEAVTTLSNTQYNFEILVNFAKYLQSKVMN